MKIPAFIAFFCAVCFGQTPAPPVCNASIQGQFWPREANSDRALARRLYQSGELQMCGLAQSKYMIRWKYKWQYVSVNARELSKTKRRDQNQR